MDSCFYCGKKLTNKTRSRDHLQPLSKNGADKQYNIVPACRPCNEEKGCLTFEEYRIVIAFRKGHIKRVNFLFPGESKNS